jgi:hypothetical protein
MTRLMPALVATVVLLACGQRGGVHQRFGPQSTTVVAQSSTGHGESAKTRTVVKDRIVATGPQHVPGGLKVLQIDLPATIGPGVSLTWPQWGALLLDRLKAPRCANNLIVIVAWAQQENTRAGWNPLATTYDMSGATSFNSAGVRNYASPQQGLDATVATLRGGFTAHGYGAIVQDLRLCADPVVTATAINASDWCHGCAGGLYVTGIVPRVIAAYVASLRSS